MEATVIIAKCNLTKEGFGIRAQKYENSWLFTWAFKISEKSASNEGYDKTNVSGVINFGSEYPGCPHCGATGFYQCGACKKIVCYNGNEENTSCPHCGNVSGFRNAESFDGIKGGDF